MISVILCDIYHDNFLLSAARNLRNASFFQLTWCDVYFTFRVLSMEHTYKYDTHIDNYPKLTALMARVQAHPKAKDCFTIATHDYKFLETA